ncbi:MAG: cellulase family glycosylhydrolase [Bacteroidales bacterium]|nr:cellulase family glycosylhydrolase [Bacteroidales bacterium]
MVKRLFSLSILILIFFSGCKRSEEKPQVFTPIDLDLFSKNMKGFNLLGKFDANFSNYGFTEEEFIILQDLGFNFVRIPLDYRTYTQAGNWDVFLENEVAKIDKVVQWGKEYGVHVCLNLHRAPGYCVNQSSLPANQDLDLWTSSAAQEAFVNHWAYFARRYKDVPYEELSFNLVNEPGDMDEAAYVSVMRKAIAKIQSITPDRVIFVDGLNYSRDIITSLLSEKNIIQAIHVYDPFTLTHYKAEWVNGSDTWPLPVWPMTNISQYLYGPEKNEYYSSLVLEGNFKKDSVVTINVQQVSIQSVLQIKLDDTEIYSKNFVCGADPGEDWTQIISTQWGYQNISGKDYSVTLPSDGTKLTITNTDGDWMTYNSMTIRSGIEKVVIIPANTTWGSMQDTYKITAEGKITDVDGNPVIALGALTASLEAAKSANIPVMIQEFGVYNKTPHDVTAAYLSDVVAIFNKNHVGYAMWNLIGTMGIINSERSDMTYEQYRGKLLDRQLTTVMQSTSR